MEGERADMPEFACVTRTTCPLSSQKIPLYEMPAPFQTSEPPQWSLPSSIQSGIFERIATTAALSVSSAKALWPKQARSRMEMDSSNGHIVGRVRVWGGGGGRTPILMFRRKNPGAPPPILHLSERA